MSQTCSFLFWNLLGSSSHMSPAMSSQALWKLYNIELKCPEDPVHVKRTECLDVFHCMSKINIFSCSYNLFFCLSTSVPAKTTLYCLVLYAGRFYYQNIDGNSLSAWFQLLFFRFYYIYCSHMIALQHKNDDPNYCADSFLLLFTLMSLNNKAKCKNFQGAKKSLSVMVMQTI